MRAEASLVGQRLQIELHSEGRGLTWDRPPREGGDVLQRWWEGVRGEKPDDRLRGIGDLRSFGAAGRQLRATTEEGADPAAGRVAGRCLGRRGPCPLLIEASVSHEADKPRDERILVQKEPIELQLSFRSAAKCDSAPGLGGATG